jgi:hypothetical protein
MGGGVRPVRTALRAALFQSVTTSAEATAAPLTAPNNMSDLTITWPLICVPPAGL